MGQERLTIHYSGHVQGVGFRWSTARALEGVDVTGFVRNLSDGKVEMVIEGEPAALRAAQERVRASMRANIRNESHAAGPATGEFQGFRIER